jgi:hypothetical protein
MKDVILGWGAAIALLSVSPGAHAQISDSLQLGTHAPVTLSESQEASGDTIITDSINFEATGLLENPPHFDLFTIPLTEPGSTQISDFVDADLSIVSVVNPDTGILRLEVDLISDAEGTGLPPDPEALAPLPETGGPQDLTADFAVAFRVSELPSIIVMSDLEAVPESSTWTMMLIGFAGLGYAAWRTRGGFGLAA